tara:strand:+ start:7226 stop:7957 length:732 start_codon:yes stop_codon:yes gene_type:complete
MKLNREDRVKILEYKFVFEEVLQVKKEYEEGSADLNYRLSFFRKKLDLGQGNERQTDVYDSVLMGKQADEAAVSNVSIDDQTQTQSAKKANSNIKPWAKKLYRKIVMATHPDKTKGLGSPHLVEQLTEQYRISQSAYNNSIYSDLIMVAFDLNIEIPTGVIKQEITPSLDFKKNNVGETKKMLGWQWYHVPEKNKDAELEKILVNLGFKFTEKEVKDVILRKYIKRKVGTRPEKINVKRRKLK